MDAHYESEVKHVTPLACMTASKKKRVKMYEIFSYLQLDVLN